MYIFILFFPLIFISVTILFIFYVYRSQPQLVDILIEKRVQMVACGEEHVGCLVLHGWVPDEEAKGCMACRKTFTAIRRRVRHIE